MSEPTTTQRASETEILLVDVVAFGPMVRVYCTELGLWTIGGRIETCGHMREIEDCRYCYDGGVAHELCVGCKG